MFECTVIRFSTHTELWMVGDLDFSQEKQAQDYWRRVQQFEPPAILLDLSALTFVDVAGARLLVRFVREAQNDGRRVAVVTGDNSRLLRPLELLQRGQEFPLYSTRGDAFRTLLRPIPQPFAGPASGTSGSAADVIHWRFWRGKSYLHSASPLAEQFLGRPAPKHISEPHLLLHWIHEEDRARVLAVHGQAEAEKRCLSVEYRVITPKRQLLWLCDVADGRGNKGKTPIRDAFTTELTGCGPYEANRPPGQAGLGTLIALEPEAAIDFGGDGRSPFVRHLIHELLRLPGNRSSSPAVVELMGSPEQAELERRLLQLLEGTEEHFEIRWLDGEGNERRHSFLLRPLSRPAPVARDLQSDQPPSHLQDHPPPDTFPAEPLRSVLIHSSDGVFVMDAMGSLAGINEAAEQITGQQRRQVLGRSVLELFSLEDRARVQSAMESLRVRQTVVFEAAPSGQSLQQTVVQATLAPICLHSRMLGTLGVIRDLTEQRQREREREEALARAQQARLQMERAQYEHRFLAEVGGISLADTPLGVKLKRIASAALPLLGECCLVDIMGDAGQLYRVAGLHVSPSVQQHLSRAFQNASIEAIDASGMAISAAMTGARGRRRPQAEPLLTPEQARVLEILPSGTALCIPLVGREGLLGALTFFRESEATPYTLGDRDLADELARLVVRGIDHTFLYLCQRELTQTLQRTLLPPRLPQIPGVSLGTAYRPTGTALDIGGDFLDVFRISDTQWAAVIGDVTGKGPTAAAVTGVVRNTLRALTLHVPTPRAALSAANRVLAGQLSGEHFCALNLVYLERQNEQLHAEIVSAGQLPPLVLRHNGDLEVLEAPGMLLGVFPEALWDQLAVSLHPGDTLVLYTDGVTEARAGRQRLGEEAFQELIRDCVGMSAAGMAARIDTTVTQFCGGEPTDDLALVIIQLPADLSQGATDGTGDGVA